MITAALSRRAEQLGAEGAAFVTATVVHVQRPASVEPGNVALVLADGTIEGFVGGLCSEHSVRAYALRALQSGNAVLLRILPWSEPWSVRTTRPTTLELSVRRTVTVENPCLSVARSRCSSSRAAGATWCWCSAEADRDHIRELGPQSGCGPLP
jgi:xanthine dehydrogenase accessory factor